MVFVGFAAKAQTPESSFYFNGFLPTAEFNNASHVVDEAGVFTPMNGHNVASDASAGLGISARFGIWCNIGYGELLPFAEASLLWNATKSTVRDEYEESSYADIATSTMLPNYFNVPLMAGLKYRYNVVDAVSPFVEFSLGVDFFFITRNGFKGLDYLTYAYKPSSSFCWNVGLGTYLGENVSVGFYYLGLGDHQITYTDRSYANHTDGPQKFPRRNLGEFALRFGFHF